MKDAGGKRQQACEHEAGSCHRERQHDIGEYIEYSEYDTAAVQQRHRLKTEGGERGKASEEADGQEQAHGL